MIFLRTIGAVILLLLLVPVFLLAGLMDGLGTAGRDYYDTSRSVLKRVYARELGGK